MTYLGTKFKVAMSNGLGGDAITRNVTDAQTDRRTDGRRTDFGTKLIYPFFLKKKAGIIKALAGMHHTPPRNIFDTKTMHKSRAITQMKT